MWLFICRYTYSYIYTHTFRHIDIHTFMYVYMHTSNPILISSIQKQVRGFSHIPTYVRIPSVLTPAIQQQIWGGYD